jgi:hypothetical protein
MRALAALTILVLALAAPAAADPIGGATYAGTHSDGGRIELTLNADGTRVVSYRADIQHGDCRIVAQGVPGDWPGADIVNGAFEYRLYDAVIFRGSFSDRLNASGTLYVDSNSTPPCNTGTLTWTAKTTASGSPPPAPGATPTPAPTPAPKVTPKPRARVTVTLRRAGTVLTGRVSSSAKACRSKRALYLQRGTRRLAGVRTKADGTFTFRRTSKLRDRTVRAVLPAASACQAAKSRSVRA